jgi:hypothetical protein
MAIKQTKSENLKSENQWSLLSDQFSTRRAINGGINTSGASRPFPPLKKASSLNGKMFFLNHK